MDVAGFLLFLGASARLTRLVTRDEILTPLRERAGNGWLGFFLVCPYCVGLWLTAATAAAYYFAPPQWFFWPALVLTGNLIWGVAQEILDTAVELHRERTTALAPPPAAPRGRGARHVHREP